MDIQLRLIQKDSNEDKENYFTLQKSVALMPKTRFGCGESQVNEEWEGLFGNPNRLCYVIELMPDVIYCGECAIKDISMDIPEIEIELLKEYQHQGIGYKAIVLMLKNLAEEYQKTSFFVKIDPDNFASQFLFEKLGAVPAGLVKCPEISDERESQFIQKYRYLLDEKMQEIAQKFDIDADCLLTHVLIYKIDSKHLKTFATIEKNNNRKEYVECSRFLSKERLKDVLSEYLEDLEEIKNYGETKDKVSAKIAEMEEKMLKRMERLKNKF